MQIDASDIGTGAWTVLTRIAADEGTASRGTAIVHVTRELREGDGSEANADAGDNPYAEQFAMHAHGAQFAEVRIDADTCEVRVPRMVGVFAVGRVLNPGTTPTRQDATTWRHAGAS